MKFYHYVALITGIVIGIMVMTLLSEWTTDNQNFIHILGVVLNGVILIIIATILNRSQNNSKALKEFFIDKLDKIEKEYSSFHDDLQDGILTKDQVTKNYKLFTMKIDQFNHFLKNNYSLSCEVQTLHRECHYISSDSYQFDMLKPRETVNLETKQKYDLEVKLKDINYLFINTSIEINKK